MGTPRPAVHRTMLAVDVCGFGALGRSQQQAVRHGLYAALEAAFVECGVPWDDDWDGTYHEDRGDGLFVLVPAGVPNSRVVSALPHALVGQLRRYNAMFRPQTGIRLRAAITAGEVLNDGNGVMGDGLVLAFRLLDCAALRDEVTRRPGELALIVSDRFYQDVVRDDAGCDPDSYRRVPVDVKEVRGAAWLSRPDHPHTPSSARPPRPAARVRWAVPVLAVLLAAPLSCDALLGAPAPEPPCPNPVQLNVLTSAEKADVVRTLAAEFEDRSRTFDGTGCKQADVYVAVGVSERSAAALGRGWPDGDVAALSPEPHVWLPDTGWEVAEVRAILADSGRTDVELDERGPVAYSQLVLGVAPDRARNPSFEWRELAAFRTLAAVDADASGAGLAAAAALVRAELDVEVLDAAVLDGPDVARRLRDVALRTAPQPAGPCPAADRAVLGSEKAIRDLTCLQAVYPTGGTVHLTHPFVSVVRRDRPRNVRREAVVQRFQDHLGDGSAQEAFRHAGFRDQDWVPEPHEGIRPDRQPALALEVDATAVRAAWRSAGRSTPVVLAVDGTARAEQLADRLTERIRPRGEVLRLDFAPGDLAGVVERGVAEFGSDRPIVVLSGTATAAPVRPPVLDSPVTVYGVGFAEGACSAVSQLGVFRAAYRGDCFAERDVDRALDLVADGLWGTDG
ncbi:substrate-binding domain-containing protein [Actinosynnema sp. NPDC023587]|uniref:substrate-binding domain-containing protein n=1 Tax=Actinosynnema sp. NPDC023587 TaxID=3154695 RepID=UPI0033FED695